MNKNKLLRKGIILLVAIIIMAAVVSISYAAWSNKLTADKVFEFTAANVTHLEFGGEGETALDGVVEPGGTISATVTARSTNETLNVKFTIQSIKVKAAGAAEFVDIQDQDKNMFTLSIANQVGTSANITNTAQELTFNFTMKKDGVSTVIYPGAAFKITIAARAMFA